MYDLTTMHDPKINYNGIIPYRSPDYVSVYDGITVEMHIVDHCNLNCAGCNHFSPLAKSWEIDIEDFSQQLIALKNNIPTVRRLILLGGEPTLHSHFVDICLKAREILPDIDITILSNGVRIKQLESQVESLKEAHIQMSICSYPGYTDSKSVQKFRWEYFNSRNLMHQTLVDESGSQNKENNYFYCGNYTLPCFTLKDYKLYICPFSAHLPLYTQRTGLNIKTIPNIDYIDIREVHNNLDLIQDFCFTPKNYCKYCKSTNSHWIWQKSFKDPVEFNTDLLDMYLTDYPRYEIMTNTNFDYFAKCYTEENPANADYIYAPQE